MINPSVFLHICLFVCDSPTRHTKNTCRFNCRDSLLGSQRKRPVTFLGSKDRSRWLGIPPAVPWGGGHASSLVLHQARGSADRQGPIRMTGFHAGQQAQRHALTCHPSATPRPATERPQRRRADIGGAGHGQQHPRRQYGLWDLEAGLSLRAHIRGRCVPISVIVETSLPVDTGLLHRWVPPACFCT